MLPLTAITCTGDRPGPFALCVEYMARQRRKPEQWIIVDDGKVPMPAIDWDVVRCGIRDVQVVRRPPGPADPAHTLPVNILAALEHVTHPQVAFIEDDDWYSPEHIASVADALLAHELVGFQGIVYYHVVKRCYRTMGESSPHSSLCQTGLTSSAFPTLHRICSSVDRASHGGFVDLRLWREFAGYKKLTKNINTVVGIKGLPGRVGLTAGWRSSEGYTPDPSCKYLESLIGQDVCKYLNLSSLPRSAP